uniref:SpaA isopeptide-forming pilin-related protein n=1 Tax=uncultured Clostridium sp. TaxID=59620 RepID=UPI00260572D1
MYRQNKKKLAITVVMFFITLLFSNFTTASADTTSTVNTITSGPYSITTAFTNSNGNTQSVYDVGSIVSIGVNITRIGTVSANDTIKITVPNALDSVDLDSSGLKGYFKVTQEETQNGEVLTLTPLADAASLVNAQLHIGGILSKDLTSGPQNIPITINGTTNEIPVNVHNPNKPEKEPDTKPIDKPNTGGGGTKPDKPDTGGQTTKPDKPNSGGSTAPVGPYSGVNWGNGIDKYIVTNNGITKNITIPVVNNNSVQYELFINTNEANGAQTITDNLPNGETYEPGSLEVYKYTADNNDSSPNLAAQYSASTNGNKLIISGFNGGTGEYRVLYKVKLSDSIGYDKNLQNVAYYNGHDSSANISANTNNTNAGVNWGNHVDKYIVTNNARGISKTMTIPTANNSTVQYKLYVDTDGLNGTQTLTDDLPSGLTYVPQSVQVYKFENNSMSLTNIASQFNVSTKNNVLSVSGFQGGTGKYVVFYNAEVSNDLGYDETLNNVAKLGGDTSTASVVVNTVKSTVTPGEESHMISKTVDPNVFLNTTKVLNYTININPNNINISDVNMTDNLPAGITLQPLNTSQGYISNLDIIPMQNGTYDNSFLVNIEEVSANGTVSYPRGEYPNPQGTLIYNLQNNSIKFETGRTSDQIKIEYSANIQPGVTNIENTATIKNNGLTASSTATSQYYSGSSALGFSKSVNKTEILPGQNSDVTYTLNVNSTGYYPNGYLKFSDPLEKGIQVEGIQVPKGFTYTIDKATNTVNFVNTGEITPGNYSVKIDASLAAFKQGTTITNTAYVGKTPSNTVSTKVGYGFEAIKEAAKTHDVLEGAIYGVYSSSSNKELSTVTSNNDGIMYGSVSEPGNYYLKEITAPKGYSVSNEEISFTIASSNLGTTIKIPTIYDKLAPTTGNIKITKTNASGDVLSGATFVAKQNGNVIQTQTTNSEGVAEFTGLPIGTYTIVETKAPTGYGKNKATESINVVGGQTTEKGIVDKEITGSINVIKTDAQTNKPVSGATFTLTGPTGFKPETAITNAEGIATFNELPWGAYSVQETTAPTEYKLNSTVYKTTINADSFNTQGVFQVPTFNVTDSELQGTLQITKTGLDGAQLNGATFTVSGPNGSKEVTTVGNGTVQVGNLPWGTYTIKETVAPAGYKLNPEVKTVVINANDAAKTQDVTINDSTNTGSIKVVKTDAQTNKPVSGAIFTLTGPTGFKSEIATTNAEGIATFNELPWGAYS